MIQFKRFNTILGLIIVLVVGGYLILTDGRGESPSQTLKVGAILPLSGDLSFVGNEIQRGMQLAQKDFPEPKIEIIYEDDQTLNTTAAVNSAQKLVNTDRVDLVLNSAVATIKGIAPMLNEKHILGIVVWDSNKEISNLGDYVFGFGFSTEGAGEDMAEHAYKNLNVKKVAVITALDEWSEIISKAFIERFTSLGGTIALQEKTKFEETDFKSIITKAKNAKADTIYFPLYTQSINALVKQTREFGFSGHLLTADVFGQSDIENLGSQAEEITLTQVWLPNEEFLDKYRETYGQETDPINLAFAGLGYDAVKLAHEVALNLQQTNKQFTGENMRNAIFETTFEGVTGKTDFSESRMTNKRESLLKVQDGSFVKYEGEN